MHLSYRLRLYSLIRIFLFISFNLWYRYILCLIVWILIYKKFFKFAIIQKGGPYIECFFCFSQFCCNLFVFLPLPKKYCYILNAWNKLDILEFFRTSILLLKFIWFGLGGANMNCWWSKRAEELLHHGSTIFKCKCYVLLRWYLHEGWNVRATTFPRPSHILHVFSSEPHQNACLPIFIF